MDRAVRAVAIAVIGSLGLATALHAQEYRVDRYTEDDGLPSSTVYSVRQDERGRIVFGTRLGVTFYDGLEWETHGVAEGLDPSDMRFLEFDGEGNLWVATVSASFLVRRYDGEHWSTLPVLAGTALDGTALHAFVLRGASAPQPVLAINSGTFLWSGSSWERLTAEGGGPVPRARALYADGDDLWLGTDEGLWVSRDGRIARPAPTDLPQRSITGIAPAVCDEGVEPCLWVAGWTWAAAVRGAGHEPLGCDGPLQFAHLDLPLELLDDGRGGVFVGSPVELTHFERGACPEKIGRLNGLVADGVQDLFRDEEGNLWVASTQGVSKVAGFHFATWRQKHGLFEDEVTSILERPDGSFLLGHRGGITLRRGDETSVVSFGVGEAERPGARVVEMTSDREGTVWIAAYHRGLARLDRDDRLTWEGQDSLAPPVSSVVVDPDGVLWVLAGNVLWRRDAGRFEQVVAFEHPIYSRRAFVLRDGTIAVGTSTVGLIVDAAGERRTITSSDPRKADVYALLERPDGSLIVGTAGGLGRVDGGEIRALEAPGLSSERPVYSIVNDRDGALWLGTDNGVVVTEGAGTRRFTVGDGLGGRETNRDAALVDSSGRVWIGTAQGVTVYRPDLAPPAHPPRVRLTAVRAGGEIHEPAQDLSLANDDDDPTFFFDAISMRDEKRIRIRTWLEGGESSWTEPRPAVRSVQYIGLSPGRYRFHVQAAVPNGDWSRVASSGWVRVRPPFWHTGWFFSIAIAAIVASVLAAQRYFVQRQYAARLEAEVEARVQELHRAQAELAHAQRLESLGVLAGGIAHDFNNLLTVILGNVSLIARRADQLGTRAYRDAGTAIRRAKELTAQLLTFARGGAPVREVTDLRRLVEESVSIALSGSRTRAELDLAEDLWLAEIDRGQIHQVLHNLLLNAVQAMPDGGLIRVVGRNVTDVPAPLESGRHVRLSVIDSGDGIDPEHLAKVFEPFFSTKDRGSGLGLASAWSIVRRHEGSLTVESAPGTGATFHLYLPAGPPEATIAAPTEDGEANRDFEEHDSGARILVMDDEPGVREVICEMLRHLGFEPVPVADGADAVEAYRCESFDAVILDLTVAGGMGGEEALRRLREIDPDVRAVAVSGYSNSPVMASYREYGFSAVLAKPFRVEQFSQVLRAVVPRSKSG